MKITENRKFNIEGIRKVCIENHLFTNGDTGTYENMIDRAKDTIPTPEGLCKIASFIADFSDDATVEDIMILLANHAVYYTFNIDLNA